MYVLCHVLESVSVGGKTIHDKDIQLPPEPPGKCSNKLQVRNWLNFAQPYLCRKNNQQTIMDVPRVNQLEPSLPLPTLHMPSASLFHSTCPCHLSLHLPISHSVLRPLLWVANVPRKRLVSAALFIWSYRLAPVQSLRSSTHVRLGLHLPITSQQIHKVRTQYRKLRNIDSINCCHK